jgi:hypothetical protein
MCFVEQLNYSSLASSLVESSAEQAFCKPADLIGGRVLCTDCAPREAILFCVYCVREAQFCAYIDEG